MPGMPCEQTREQLVRLQPKAAVLLASGYTGSQVVQLVSTRRLRLLRKPFDPQELLTALHAALEARTR
jgi:DNA-binding NtrC family response regulator